MFDQFNIFWYDINIDKMYTISMLEIISLVIIICPTPVFVVMSLTCRIILVIMLKKQFIIK